MRFTLAVVLLGACGSTETIDAGDDATTVDVTDPGDAGDVGDAHSFDCGDACCIQPGMICGIVTDASTCSACCDDAWRQIPKTLDLVCTAAAD